MTLFQKLCAFIPSKVNNTTVIRFFELLRAGHRRADRNSEVNYEMNRAAFSRHADSIKAAGGFIEDQPSWEDLAFGKVTMRYAGCEVFAVYNALTALSGGSPVSLPDLIRDFERDGIVLGGRFGTAPKAIADYFESLGYRTEFTADADKFDALAAESDTLILTMYNDARDIRRMIHSVSITKKDGLYTAHNVDGRGSAVGPFRTVTDFIGSISGGHAKGISLSGIRK